jgi:hypothetical protein
MEINRPDDLDLKEGSDCVSSSLAAFAHSVLMYDDVKMYRLQHVYEHDW